LPPLSAIIAASISATLLMFGSFSSTSIAKLSGVLLITALLTAAFAYGPGRAGFVFDIAHDNALPLRLMLQAVALAPRMPNIGRL
jgi:hypothetical protein